METLDKIILYEQGDLTNDETIELFQEQLIVAYLADGRALWAAR